MIKFLHFRYYFVFLFLSTFSIAALAEGSANLYPTTGTGYRALLQTRTPTYTSSVQFDPFATLGTMNVYAKAGEVIYVGSSAQGVTSGAFTGTINLRAPDGSTYSSGTNTSIGKINYRAQETNGPKRGTHSADANYYTPYTVTVGAGQEGIWKVDFAPAGDPTSLGISNTYDKVANYSWINSDLATYQNGLAAILAFDVSVGVPGSDNLIMGRAFCNTLNLNMPIDGSKGLNCSLYVLTNVGYVYYMNTNALNGGGFNVFTNNKGIQTAGNQYNSQLSWWNGEPSYASAEYTNPPSNTTPIKIYDPRLPDNGTEDVTHKLFFTKPDITMPATANIWNNFSNSTIQTWLMYSVNLPSVTAISIVGAESGATGLIGPDGANIAFTSNVAGKYNIVLSATGYTTRMLAGDCVHGANLVNWDGYDGATTPVRMPSGTSVTVQGSITAGEVHFPLADVEYNNNGVIIELLQPGSVGYISYPTRKGTVYWNNDTSGSLPPTVSSGNSTTNNGNKWPSANFGDKKILDTWSYVGSESLTAAVAVITKQLDLAVSSITPSVTSVCLSNTTASSQTITYTVVVENLNTNVSYVDAVNAKFGFEAPTGFVVTGHTFAQTSGTCTESNQSAIGTNKYTANVNLTKGGKITYSITGTVGTPLLDGASMLARAYIIRPADITDIDATSSITGTPTDPDLECDGGAVGCNNIKTATSVGIVDCSSDLSVTKVVDNSTPKVGDNVVFTITAINNGSSNATGVMITDLLPVGYSYVSDDSSLTSTTYISTTGVWNVGSLAKNANKVLKVTAKVL